MRRFSHVWLVVVIACGVAIVSLLAAPRSHDPSDYPDPCVVRAGDEYLAFASDVGDLHIPVRASRDLIAWGPARDALPALPRWALDRPGLVWAPAVAGEGDRWHLFYTARCIATGLQSITVAHASDPRGPYRDDSEAPLIASPELGGAIDPSVFRDHGKSWLLWKSDGNAIGLRSRIWIQALAEDGATLVGRPQSLIEHDQDWESPLIEGPAMVADGGRYYLFYSAAWWFSDRYAIGYAVGESPTGPFRKVPGPWLASSGDRAGPGGEELVTAVDGTLMMVFHAWTPPRIGYPEGARSMRVAPLAFVDGVPVLGPERRTRFR